MAFSVVMPALEMAQESGKLIAWRKKEGDRVAKGEPLLEIETDKAVVELEAPADGLLVGIKAAAGADVPVGQTIAWIVVPGETPPLESAPSTATAPRASHPEAKPAPTPAHDASGPALPSRVKISPKARRLAKELKVDIAAVRGSGPEGEILASDIEASAAVDRPASKVRNLELPGSVGRVMAERTTQSWTTVPHFFVSREIDAAALQDYRNRIAAAMEPSDAGAALTKMVRITHTDLLVALVAHVLLRHPRLNASWSAEGIRIHDHVNMGIAIAVNDGVVAAVIPNAHSATLAQIASRRVELTERAFAGKLRPADISDATFTISNLGMYHVDQFSALIAPPQAAVLAVGAIADRVVAINGRPAVRPRMTLTLSCDHRVADGARAALFLNDLAEAVRQPGKSLG